jgi:cytochrome bd-type quinol oxidase subunit 2
MRKTIFQCGAVWLAASLLQWWLFFYSPLNIPTYITLLPGAPLNIRGLILVVVMTLILRVFLKKYLQEEPEASISDLTSIGLLSVLLAEIVFQLIRQFSYTEYTSLEHLLYYMMSVFGMPLFAGIISLSIAARLKKNKNKLIPLIVIVLLVLLGFGYRYLQSARILE